MIIWAELNIFSFGFESANEILPDFKFEIDYLHKLKAYSRSKKIAYLLSLRVSRWSKYSLRASKSLIFVKK